MDEYTAIERIAAEPGAVRYSSIATGLDPKPTTELHAFLVGPVCASEARALLDTR